jgi:hypothetical protein
MSKILDEVLQANEQYAAGFGEKGKLALPPARLRRATSPFRRGNAVV